MIGEIERKSGAADLILSLNESLSLQQDGIYINMST